MEALARVKVKVRVKGQPKNRQLRRLSAIPGRRPVSRLPFPFHFHSNYSGMPTLRKTPLRDFHAAHGARLVDFAGWEMPVQYRSILEEHKAVRRAAGLFDVSHMGELDVRGADAARFLNHLVTNDVAKLFPGRVLYSPMCYPNGGVVDDLLVYMRGAEDFFLCINAGNIDKDLAWIRDQAAKFNVAVTDRSADYA